VARGLKWQNNFKDEQYHQFQRFSNNEPYKPPGLKKKSELQAWTAKNIIINQNTTC
jgi:hypothetical protein